MSVCFNVLFAWKCSSTHHKLAMDALRHLRSPQSNDWTNLCLRYIEFYLDGSKAPDNKFKDFRNHVLHVRDNYWGGAIAAAESWYGRTVEALRQQQWPDAIYNAGVLSHYFTDPIQPFHTGQSDAEAIVHRAAEWSIAKCYEEFQNILEENLGGYPEVEIPNRPDWLAEMIRQGARLANPHYETLIDHYNLAAGVKNPPAGLDQESKDIIAPLIGHAAVGFARVLERAIGEARATPPMIPIELHSILNSLTVPVYAVTKKMRDAKERIQVEAMFKEYSRTGKVIFTLPEDDKAIRRLHAEEVLNKSLAELDLERVRAPGKLHGQGAPARETSRKPCTRPISNYAPPLVPSGPLPVAKLRPAAQPKKLDRKKARELVRNPTEEEPLPKLRAAPPEKPPYEKPRPIVAKKQAEEVRRPIDGGLEHDDTPLAEPPRREPVRQPIRQPEPEPDFEELPVRKAAEEHAPATRGKLSRFYLEKSMPLAQAPSIGNKTAGRFERIGTNTVAEFLELDPESAARKLNVKHISGDTIRDWQAQARLACRVPNIRGHDAQILVACGVESPEELASSDADKLLASVLKFCGTSDGQRILRSSPKPDLDEVSEWIASAGEARTLRAA